MPDFTWAIVGGIVIIVIMGGALWLVTQVTVEIIDWIAGAIETAWRKAGGK